VIALLWMRGEYRGVLVRVCEKKRACKQRHVVAGREECGGIHPSCLRFCFLWRARVCVVIMPVVLQCIALVAWGHDVAYGVVHLTVTYLMACCCREARRMLLVVEHGHRHDLLVIVVWACRGILAVPAMQVVIVPVVREFFLVADLAADGRYLLTVTCPLTDLVVLGPG